MSFCHLPEVMLAVIFLQTLCVEDGKYNKHEQWERSVHLGSGVSGKTYLALDGMFGQHFCIKEV